ncbi:MAG: hypothetical protein R3D66_05630 [Alphaproteobacteria bacterium]
MLAAMALCSTDAINNAWIYASQRMPPDLLWDAQRDAGKNGTEGGLYRQLMTDFTKHGLDQTPPIQRSKNILCRGCKPAYATKNPYC